MSKQSDDDWVTDDDGNTHSHPRNDVAVAGSGCVTPPSGASPLKKAADANRRQKAREGESPAKAALRITKNAAAMQRKRLAKAAEEITDVDDVAAAGSGCVTPPSGASPLKKAADANRRQKARQGESPAKAALRLSKHAAAMQRQRSADAAEEKTDVDDDWVSEFSDDDDDV
jgi:hypothetical protein